MLVADSLLLFYIATLSVEVVMKLVLAGAELEGEEPVDLLVEAAQNHNIHWLDLWFDRNLRVKGKETTIRMISDAGLEIICVSSGTKLFQDNNVARDQKKLLAAIEFAHEVGAPYANTYFGFGSHRDDDMAIELYRSHVESCLDRAVALGVTLLLENEFDCFGEDPASSDISRRPHSLYKLVERVDAPNFRLTFDPCNAYFAGIEPYPWAYEILKPFIQHIHVKDGRRLTEPSKDTRWKQFLDEGRLYSTWPLGRGAINWTGLIHQLAADNYQGFLTIEPHAYTSYRSAAWSQAIHTIRSWIS